MPPRSWKIRVQDIVEAIQRIQSYTKNIDQKAFLNDQIRIDAVIHNLTVIGEAVVHIPEDVQNKHPTVPWAQMRGIRNVLVHEYYKISPGILWKTINDDLPPLLTSLSGLLK